MSPPDDQGSSPSLGTACPACGIAVPTGYRRCPKCHEAIEGAGDHGGDASAIRVQGGTSVSGGGGLSTGWMVAIGGLAVVAAVVLFVVVGSGNGEQTESAKPVVAPDLAPPAPRVVRNTRPVARPVEEPAQPDDSAGDLAAAAGSLEARLDRQRIWATVEVDGDRLAVHSAYCAEEGMDTAIEAVADLMREAGVTVVICYERHGPKVFERPLSVVAPQGGGDAP